MRESIKKSSGPESQILYSKELKGKIIRLYNNGLSYPEILKFISPDNPRIKTLGQIAGLISRARKENEITRPLNIEHQSARLGRKDPPELNDRVKTYRQGKKTRIKGPITGIDKFIPDNSSKVPIGRQYDNWLSALKK